MRCFLGTGRCASNASLPARSPCVASCSPARERRSVKLPNNQSYFLPFDPTFATANHMEPDPYLVTIIRRILSEGSVDGAPRFSINDFGGGVGKRYQGVQPSHSFPRARDHASRPRVPRRQANTATRCSQPTLASSTPGTTARATSSTTRMASCGGST